MIIYNVTVKVDSQISAFWMQWLVEEHIPEIMSTGCFSEYRLVRLIDVDDSDGPTYAIQFSAASKSDYNRYMELHAGDMRKKSFEKWGDRFIAFRTLMEVVQ